MKAEVTFASFKAPYHAHALAELYKHHFFRLSKLDNLVKKRRIKKAGSYLFLVGAYVRANGYKPDEIVPLYNRLANGYTKTIIAFAGSDVLQLKSFNSRYKKDFLKFLNRKDVVVAAVGDYMAKEVLDNYGIKAEIIYMPMNHEFSGIPAPMPKKFSVGCYMPRSGNVFYGYDVIMETIKLLPDIDFHFYSLLGYVPTKEEDKVKNLICHKNAIDRNKMEDFLDNLSCGLRITEHDGNPMSLAEYNSAGRYFVFNKPMPHCKVVIERDPKKIAESIKEVKSQAKTINSGVDFYLKRHDKNSFWTRIMKIYGT